MKTEKKKVTVLILDERNTQTLQVNPVHLKAIRPVIIGLSLASVGLLSVCLGLSIAYGNKALEMAQFNNEKSQLQQQVVDLQNATSEEVERKISALRKSEQSITQLQKYLNDRGVKINPVNFEAPAGKPNDAAGGPEMPLFQEVPYTGSYANDVIRLLKAAQQVPMGRPHYGELSSRFGIRANPFSGRGSEAHMGLDFRANVGDPIYSTADGIVVFAGTQNGYGNLVQIRHGYGYTTHYGHLSAIKVKSGEHISAGDIIALAGSTGRSTGPHLHYEVRRNNQPIDPEAFLSINANAR